MSKPQMTRRERILAAIEHRPVDKVPIGFDIFEPVREGVLRAACKKGAPLLTRPSPAHPFPLSLWPPPCA